MILFAADDQHLFISLRRWLRRTLREDVQRDAECDLGLRRAQVALQLGDGGEEDVCLLGVASEASEAERVSKQAKRTQCSREGR